MNLKIKKNIFYKLIYKIKNIFCGSTISDKLTGLVLSVLFPSLLMLLSVLIFSLTKMNTNIDKHFNAVTNSIADRYAEKVIHTSMIAKLISNTPEIVDNAEIRQTNVIIDTLKVFSSDLNIPFTSVHDLEGLSLGKGHNPNELVANDSNEEYVKIGLLKRKVKGMIIKLSRGPALLSIYPIFSANQRDRMIGIATSGYILNSKFANILKGSSNGEIIFIYNNEIYGSTLKNRGDIISKKNNILKAIKLKTLNNIEIGNNRYKTKTINLLNSENKTFQMIIAIDITKEKLGFLVTLLVISILFIINTFLSIYFSKRMSAKIIEPVYELVDKSTLVSNGALEVRASIDSNDEMEILGNTFNYMIENIEEKQRIISSHLNNAIHIISMLISHSSTRIYEHMNLVKKISVLLAKKNNLDYSDVWDIEIAATLVDLGKIGNIERLDYSKRKLTEDEKNIIRSHIQKTIRIIENLPYIENVKNIIAQHHERYDGSGYPNKLKKSEIIIGARIIGIVDDFVTMLKQRKFQSIDKKEKIVNELKSKKGILYDPDILESFIQLIEEENLIYIVNEDDIKKEILNNTIIWTIPSNIHFEPIVANRVIDEISKKTSIDDEMSFSIDFGICEIVRNAIIHGNKYDENKSVKITLTINELENGEKETTIKVRDFGEGMDVGEHNLFSESRKELFSIFSRLKRFFDDSFKNNKQMENIVYDLSSFSTKYYSDYHSFKQLEDQELSGGIGLLQVKTTFDNVEFKNIIHENKICGLEVTMLKYLK